MSPHWGQLFALRVVDLADSSEVGRIRVESIPLVGSFPIDFSVSVPGLTLGGSYNIDFYADFNGNGRYDPPGMDHAWRMTVDNASGDTTLHFAHNTIFTDVLWDYLTVNLTGMTPYAGQLLELKVVDLSDSTEVGRIQLDSIATANFSVSLPGLMLGGIYNVDFYADFNGNGQYDVPGTDHAWRLGIEYAGGYAVLDFAHNTSFTDVMWDYLTVNFTDMTPHLNQLFELRVESYTYTWGGVVTGEEIGIVRLDSINAADFSVSVPGLMLDGSYNIDFYADFNGNGQYDVPGTDHAWRLGIHYAGGYAAVDFSHNTDFTDIEWPYSPLFVAPENNGLPESFNLAQNYPNPFNPSTILRFDLPQASTIKLVVYDLLGREIAALADRQMSPGYHSLAWDGRSSDGREVPSGIYIARLVAPGYTKSIKIVLLK
ncbi:MAG: T9SS type A sorting domain-containing protein [Candidatus Marinimicrobia bacterium]|nr:T9SS type A sorting domain-containing protein [Candidatus Neomarinimicrobiota bacterium]